MGGIKIDWELGNGLVLQHMRPEQAPGLEELQRIVFPTLAQDELIRAPHYLRHLELFPEGQLVIVYTGGDHPERIGINGTKEKNEPAVIAMTTTMRSQFDFTQYHHTFKETIAGGWMTNHDPNGDWLYGLDMGVHPDWRGRGLARMLYRARHQVARALGLRGQLTVGMMSGYGAVGGTGGAGGLKHGAAGGLISRGVGEDVDGTAGRRMSGADYYQELLEGKRSDPTISVQMKMGFEPMGLIPDYLHDPVCGNYGVLLRLGIEKEV